MGTDTSGLTEFQQAALPRTAELLEGHGLRPTFQLIEGQGEVYLRCKISKDEDQFEIFIYLDEAGIGEMFKNHLGNVKTKLWGLILPALLLVSGSCMSSMNPAETLAETDICIARHGDDGLPVV